MSVKVMMRGLKGSALLAELPRPPSSSSPSRCAPLVASCLPAERRGGVGGGG